MADWQPISTAPKDGTKVDLWYPYPRCRQIDCYWSNDKIWGPGGTWIGKCEPVWEDGVLLPPEEWYIHTLPNMQPTHWMLSPGAPK